MYIIEGGELRRGGKEMDGRGDGKGRCLDNFSLTLT